MTVRAALLVCLAALPAIAVACAAGSDTRRFEWTGLTFNAGMEIHHVLTPLDERLVTETPEVRTSDIRNDGSAVYEFKFGGQITAGRVYYWVDGTEDGVCDEDSPIDVVGFHEWPEGQLVTEIVVDYDAPSPEGACLWFRSAPASGPTPAPTVPGATAAPTPTAAPDWATIHGDAPFEAYLTWLDAYATFDVAGAVAMLAEGTKGTVEYTITQEMFLVGLPESGFWRRYVDVTYQDASCTESRCEFEVSRVRNTSGVSGTEEQVEVVMTYEDGAWKLGE